MIAASFIDTNVLIYAASNAAADQAKRQIARALLTRSDIGFSAQMDLYGEEPGNYSRPSPSKLGRNSSPKRRAGHGAFDAA
jgi:hypothetical protein